MTRRAEDVPRDALLEQVGDLLAVAVDQPAREIILERAPELRVTVLGELAQAEPCLLALAAQLVQRQDLVLRLVQLGWEFPPLDLEDDTEDLDAPVLAVLDELRVIDEPVHAEAGIDLLERLLLEIGQRDGPAAERRPDQRGCPVGLEIFDHLQPAGRQAGVIAVLTREPGVEVDSALHISDPFCVRRGSS